MKKVFFSFAIATMMASLVACGGKTGQNAEGQDSTAVEAEAEAADPNRQDLDNYSVVVPEGWVNQAISDFFIRLKDEPKYAYKSERLYVESVFYKEKTAASYIENIIEYNEAEEIGTKKIDGVDFAVYSVKNDRDTLVQLIGERDGHVYSFKTNELSYDNADIQKILESIKLK